MMGSRDSVKQAFGEMFDVMVRAKWGQGVATSKHTSQPEGWRMLRRGHMSWPITRTTKQNKGMGTKPIREDTDVECS